MSRCTQKLSTLMIHLYLMIQACFIGVYQALLRIIGTICERSCSGRTLKQMFLMRLLPKISLIVFMKKYPLFAAVILFGASDQCWGIKEKVVTKF